MIISKKRGKNNCPGWEIRPFSKEILPLFKLLYTFWLKCGILNQMNCRKYPLDRIEGPGRLHLLRRGISLAGFRETGVSRNKDEERNVLRPKAGGSGRVVCEDVRYVPKHIE